MNDPQFRATNLWNSMVNNLRSSVANIKPHRRRRLWSHEDGFSGTDAIDIVYRYLKNDCQQFLVANEKIERHNAFKVCQVLLNQRILEPCNSSHRNGFPLFEDNTSRHYRFTDTDIGSVVTAAANSSFRRALEENVEEKKTVFYESPTRVISNQYIDENNSDHVGNGVSTSPTSVSAVPSFSKATVLRRSERRFRKMPPMLRKLRSLTSINSPPTKPTLETMKENANPSEMTDTLLTTLQLEPLEGKCHGIKRSREAESFDEISERSLKKTNPTVEDIFALSEMVWKKLSLARLLTIVDVQFLEDLLPILDLDYGLTSTQLECIDIPPFVDDIWVKTAQLCVNFPLTVDPRDQVTAEDVKIAVFKLVVGQYLKRKIPFVPDSLKEIFVTILGLLKEKRLRTALLALQLAIILLPWRRRNQLQKLLQFLNVVANDRTVTLSKKFTNRHVVLRSFGSSILKFQLFGAEETAILVFFLIHNHSALFTRPYDLKCEVERIVTSVSNDEEPEVKSAILFCRPVSSSVYSAETANATRNELRFLLEAKLKEMNISSREKSKWLHKFSKAHPDIYNEYFKRN